MSSISFDQAVSYYDATRGYPPGIEEQVADAIVQAVGATNATHFLEMGIGTGRIAFPLIKRGYPYTGVDLSQPMMDVLRVKVADYATAHADQPAHVVDLHRADMTALPFADAQFDVTLMVHVLHLIPNWQDAIGEALRVLKPGGFYLNCGDDQVATPRSSAVRDLWTEIIKAQGYDPHQGFSASAQNAIAEIERRGYQPEVLRTVTWQTAIAPRTMFITIAQRLWSRTWSIPNDAFATSIERLKNELEARYGDTLDIPEQRTTQFVITRVHK